MQEKVTEKMLATQQKAAAAEARPATPVENAQFYYKIGHAFSELKDYLGSLKAYRKSQEIYRELGLHLNESQCCYALGVTLFNSGKFVESLDTLKQCLKMYEELDEREEQISECHYWVERAEVQVRSLSDLSRAHQARKTRQNR